MSEMNTTNVLIAILTERMRQKNAEGYTEVNDDKYLDSELPRAAAAYVCASIPLHESVAKALWPWNWTFWKPTDRRRNLIKAAALIVAEIERLDRAEEVLRE